MTTQTNGNNLVIQGRIIWTLGSSLFAGKQKTDMQTNQPILNANNEPVIEYGFGLAIPKVDPATRQNTAEYLKVWETLHNEAFTLYPNGQLPPGFAMKFKDGDGIDHNGKNFADREGYAGHIVISCTTRIPIKYFVFQGGNNVLVNDGIKCGDYVNAQLNIKAHPAKGQGKPGLYVNPGAVQLIQEGKEIINTPSGDQLFGQAAPTYVGQVVAPTVATIPGQLPGQVAPMTTPGLPAAQPSPHYDVLPQTHQPAPMTTPGLPAAQHNPAMPGQLPAVHAPLPGQPAPMTTPGLPAAQHNPAMPGMP